MSERRYLKKSILLCGESSGGTFLRSFRILKKIDEGASAVCYEACHEQSGRGVLKEFYPRTAYGLERNADGQLIHAPGLEDAYERFLQAEKEYLEPYEMMLEVKRNSEDQDIATFIPAFEIYRGYSETGGQNGTVYIWTPEPKLETFDTLCAEIHRHPTRNPEHKLVTVLLAIDTLTKCVCAMHSADMIHRDIKPSNFGFLRRGDEILTQALSMFDINSVCSVYGKNEGVVGTQGYLEPEAGYASVSNQTDIYAIGATLFHAIAVTDETEKNGYVCDPSFYGRLREIVDSSRLIQASESNSHPRLRNILTVILQKCLSARTYRYENCEELREDLEKALYYALPSGIANKKYAGEKWILADIEKSLDANKEKNSTLAIQCHLFEHPLYRCAKAEEEVIRVLVTGFGSYGQKFLDACLQVGQMPGKRLNVTVVSDDAADKDLYLSERPALTRFFNVDGSLPENDESYGDIGFRIMHLNRDDQAENARILKRVMRGRPHYVFIALGDDALNYSAAKACRAAAGGESADCVISFVSEDNRLRCDDGLNPLYVNEETASSPLYPEIERMAFNVHLLWEKNLNIDIKSIKTEFKKKYNHDSCVSNVLSLKYKLHCLGIELNDMGFDRAASEFRDRMTDENSRQLRNELICVEHRRWVTEKLCLGWQEIADPAECADGVTRDSRRKRHICLRRSRPDRKLADEYGTDGNFAKWDDAAEEELDQLDELDRMSVDLHRVYAKKAAEAVKQNLLSGEHLAGIRSLIEGYKKATIAFQEWTACVKDIRYGNMGKVHLYRGLKNRFLEFAGAALPQDRCTAVCGLVKAFETIFYPVIAAMEYRDWKQDDVTLVDNIPFILTYTENAYMVIPFSAGGNHTAVFGNVASATIVNPGRILYLCYAENGQDLNDLKKTVPSVLEYMQKKQLRAVLEFILVCTGQASRTGGEYERELKALGRGRIQAVQRIEAGHAADVPVVLKRYLMRRAVRKKMFAAEKNDTALSRILEAAGFYHEFASYRFESASMTFTDDAGCRMLEYIPHKPFMSVTDLTAVRASSGEGGTQPEFCGEYETLWERYRADPGAWKQLCRVLKEYSDTHDILEVFGIPGGEERGEVQRCRYILPAVCGRSAAVILDCLQQHGVIESGSRVCGYTTASCEVIVLDRCGYREKFDRLFSCVYALMQPEAVRAYQNPVTKKIEAAFDCLVVNGLHLPDEGKEKLTALLEFLESMNYIIRYREENGGIGFTYAAGQIRELLTTEEKLPEVFIYHKIKETGVFDDVLSGDEIEREDPERRNAFDCILTRGFRTLFVACRSGNTADDVSCRRLAEQAERLGINASAVMIADTELPDAANGMNGDVIVIRNPREINQIGRILLKIADGEYTRDCFGKVR